MNSLTQVAFGVVFGAQPLDEFSEEFDIGEQSWAMEVEILAGLAVSNTCMERMPIVCFQRIKMMKI